ncbi:MAG: extensin family protein [Hyphomicrobiaceae bacterium]|nr:extensin family protein [Hyphomicrobiaceae bacterium]
MSGSWAWAAVICTLVPTALVTAQPAVAQDITAVIAGFGRDAERATEPAAADSTSAVQSESADGTHAELSVEAERAPSEGAEWPRLLPPKAAHSAHPAVVPDKPATEPPRVAHVPAGAIAAAPSKQPAAGEPAPQKSGAWTAADIELGRARCRRLLHSIDAVVVPLDPIKAGSCGTAAPVSLVSVGKSPQVSLSPPVVVNCDLVAAMHTWVTKHLQPAAKKHLGAPLVTIQTMSSYSCRNAYGRADRGLSEHGRANAIDISGFLTAKAVATHLIADWGPTQRDIERTRLAEAEAAAKAAAAQVASPATPAPTVAAPAGQPAPTARAATVLAATSDAPVGQAATAEPAQPTFSFARSTLVEGLPRLPDFTGNGRQGFGISPSRLGGPALADLTDAAPAVPAIPAAAKPAGTVKIDKGQFLREAQRSACIVFGTVLGPEANNAHRNHFHVDLADRGGQGSFCR